MEIRGAGFTLDMSVWVGGEPARACRIESPQLMVAELGGHVAAGDAAEAAAGSGGGSHSDAGGGKRARVISPDPSLRVVLVTQSGLIFPTAFSVPVRRRSSASPPSVARVDPVVAPKPSVANSAAAAAAAAAPAPAAVGAPTTSSSSPAGAAAPPDSSSNSMEEAPSCQARATAGLVVDNHPHDDNAALAS